MSQAFSSGSNIETHSCGDPLEFDPWTATENQAVLHGSGVTPGTTTPLVQQRAALEVMNKRDACLKIDGGCQVLECLSICLANHLMPPEWLCAAFVERHSRVVNAHSATWDDAFGRPWPSRTRLDCERQAMHLKTVIHAAVLTLVRDESELPIGRDLFERVGEMPGIHKSGATVERLYYKALSEGLPNVARLRPNFRNQYSPMKRS